MDTAGTGQNTGILSLVKTQEYNHQSKHRNTVIIHNTEIQPTVKTQEYSQQSKHRNITTVKTQNTDTSQNTGTQPP